MTILILDTELKSVNMERYYKEYYSSEDNLDCSEDEIIASAAGDTSYNFGTMEST